MKLPLALLILSTAACTALPPPSGASLPPLPVIEHCSPKHGKVGLWHPCWWFDEPRKT